MLDIIDYRLKLSRPLKGAEAILLRGYFGNLHGEEVALHHHNPDGSLLYDYPRIQFKILNRSAHLLGLAEGRALVMRLWSEVEQARLGEEELPVLEGSLVRRRESFGETGDLVSVRKPLKWHNESVGMLS